MDIINLDYNDDTGHNILQKLPRERCLSTRDK